MKELEMILDKFNDEKDFKQVIDDKKKGLRMWTRREQGKSGVVFKFEARNIKMHIFNLLTLVNETDLYDQWFPQCKRSYTVNI